jgi:cbb3-type cytochrome oxidase maturation protein
MSNATTLIVMWAAVAVVGIGGATLALVWAVRSRQFSDQDRARRLPLDETSPSREDKRVPH